MKEIIQIREFLSLTQPEFAAHLGISRSLLSMAETGRRELPLKALRKFNAICIELENLKQSKNTESQARMIEQEEISQNQQHILLEAEYNEALAIRLTRKLKVMEEKFQQTIICELLLKNLIAQGATGRTRKSLELQLDHIPTRLREVGPANQFILHEKILQHSGKGCFCRTLLGKLS